MSDTFAAWQNVTEANGASNVIIVKVDGAPAESVVAKVQFYYNYETIPVPSQKAFVPA